MGLEISSQLAMNNEKTSNRKRVCLLTGASGKLGVAFCDRFASHYEIAAIYNKHIPPVPSDLVRAIDPLDPKSTLEENASAIFAIRADLSESSEHMKVIELALARFSRIDLVVHAAGTAVRGDLLSSNQALASFGRQFNMNTFVPLSVSIQLLRRSWMRSICENRTSNRNIIAISSTSADTVYKSKGQGIYSASKAALDALTKHMAVEFAQFGVRVNAVAPDSFPQRVPIDTVLDAILHVDEGTSTGEIIRLESTEIKSRVKAP
jgi:NAD(P)-dependent dehydrogenase (short-subunit alcohol dehydrogenase family)